MSTSQGTGSLLSTSPSQDPTIPKNDFFVDDYLVMNGFMKQSQAGTRESPMIDALCPRFVPDHKGSLPLISGNPKHRPSSTRQSHLSTLPSPPRIQDKRLRHSHVSRSLMKGVSFNPQELDLPLDDDLWMPSERISEFLTKDGSTTADRGMLFPWMSDSEIV